ncbi:MAG: exodeoxyribonuclease III [Candidatus Omnitrophica bacterium]|jgi:exodeoxyribonuclease-3|nr:exodeoxyribonuclease III [Candidatus Omnitrophota bacterium]
MPSVKMISWNVNGARAALRAGLADFVAKEKPDVLCLQETKAPAGGMTLGIAGYHEYWNDAKKPGYAGTALICREKPLSVHPGIGKTKHDGEGRVIAAEFSKYYVISVYVPNSKRGLERLPYRTQEWDKDFLAFVRKLEKKKPVIFCGDLNVAHAEIDLANPKANVKNHGFTPEERAGFDAVLKAGFVDTFRHFEKGPGHYTWWSRLSNCRARNIGWRIDYFIVSPKLVKRLKRAWILKDVKGSDHCPVGIELLTH